MKSRDGKSQRRGEKKKEDQKRESLRRKKMQMREKVGKSRNGVFPRIYGSGGSKSRLAKAEGAEPCGQMKSCTPLWRTAHFQFKIYKTHQVRTTFGSCDVEKVHAVVARSTFWSQKCKKTDEIGALLEVQMSFCVAGARDYARCQKWAKHEGFVAFSNDGRRGTFAEDVARCLSRGRRSTRDMFIRAVRRSGRWFAGRGCILEHQIFKFAEMILRDRCSTSYYFASLLRGRRSTLDTWTGKIAKRIGARPWALHSTFDFWRKSRRIASFLLLSTSETEKVSQNSFVFDVAAFKTWGSLAELLRFWCCQVQKFRKSPRIASFSNLQTDRQIDR